MLIDFDPVRALQSCRSGELINWKNADTNNDHVGWMFRAVFRQYGANAFGMRMTRECAHLGVADDAHAVRGGRARGGGGGGGARGPGRRPRGGAARGGAGPARGAGHRAGGAEPESGGRY